LGALKQHPEFRRSAGLSKAGNLSYFTPDAARSLPLAGPQKHLNIHGIILETSCNYRERVPKKFQSILDKIAGKIPGVDKISTEKKPGWAGSSFVSMTKL